MLNEQHLLPKKKKKLNSQKSVLKSLENDQT